MRIRIAREGFPSVDGRLIERFALYPRQSILPVSVFPTGDLVGRVSKFKRHDDGWITAELELFHDLPYLDRLSAEASCDSAEHADDDEYLRFKSLRLNSVVLGRTPVWEGMEINAKA